MSGMRRETSSPCRNDSLGCLKRDTGRLKNHPLTIGHAIKHHKQQRDVQEARERVEHLVRERKAVERLVALASGDAAEAAASEATAEEPSHA